MKKVMSVFLVLTNLLFCLTGCVDYSSLEDTYTKAFQLIAQGEYEDAEKLFMELGDYKDSKEQLNNFYLGEESNTAT